MSEFLHEMSGSILQRERYFEHRQRPRLSARHEDDYNFIIIPEVDNLSRQEIDRRYVRLLGSSIYIQEDMAYLVPSALESRLERDSEQFFTSFPHMENARYPEICGHYAMRQAYLPWTTITYECLGCNNPTMTRGEPIPYGRN